MNPSSSARQSTTVVVLSVLVCALALISASSMDNTVRYTLMAAIAVGLLLCVARLSRNRQRD